MSASAFSADWLQKDVSTTHPVVADGTAEVVELVLPLPLTFSILRVTHGE